MHPHISGEFIWYRNDDQVSLAIAATKVVRLFVERYSENHLVYVSNLELELYAPRHRTEVVFRHPTTLFQDGGRVTAGPVYAILAGSKHQNFAGNRADFRELLATAQSGRKFLYVLPVTSVTNEDTWNGYVRLADRRWCALPCPIPQAIYNRIPTRVLEHARDAQEAKARLREMLIPMFNPGYFNKAVIFTSIRSAQLARYIPETSKTLSRASVEKMLERYHDVYLKPAGGSIGHGLIRIQQEKTAYQLSVLKHGMCKRYTASSLDLVWHTVCQQRLPGSYIVQEAKPLLKWDGQPCDFRLLLQKSEDVWGVVGKGVRVAGPDTIATHVPNGGHIADAERVLLAMFGQNAPIVNQRLDKMAVLCAKAIDEHYRQQLGELSMDIGVDERGQMWVFEANAKPMKFDEPDIRERSLHGVIHHLDEIADGFTGVAPHDRILLS